MASDPVFPICSTPLHPPCILLCPMSDPSVGTLQPAVGVTSVQGPSEQFCSPQCLLNGLELSPGDLSALGLSL